MAPRGRAEENSSPAIGGRVSGLDQELGEGLLRRVQALAFPRAAGSEGDARVRRLLSEGLRAAGWRVREDRFAYSLKRPWALLRAGLASLAAALAAGAAAVAGAPHAGAWCAGAAGLAALGIAGAAAGVRWDSLYFAPPGELCTANVVADAGGGPVRILLVAHHDSKSQNLPLLLRGFLVAAGAAGAVSLAAAAIQWALFGVPARLLAGVTAAGALSLAALATLTFGNRSPGALDNAASLAVLLELARRLAGPEGPPAGVRLVLTGAEEHLMAGARRLAADRSLRSAREPLVLNLDGVGAPGPVGVAGERSLRRRVLRLAREAGIPARRAPLPPGTGTDALPLAWAGLRAVTLTSGRLSRAVLRVHSPADRPDGLDAASLAAAFRLTERCVREILAARDGDGAG
ncbi:MAG: M28 family peptidase [Acidobacteria bacterium]|nr:MAG: M28 family peptidase [Acidobacteriota bacterium]